MTHEEGFTAEILYQDSGNENTGQPAEQWIINRLASQDPTTTHRHTEPL